MGGGNSTQGAPVDAVRSEPDGPVEHQAVGGLFDGAVGEDGAVENLTCHVRVARDDDSGLAEGEGHEAFGVAGAGHGGDFAVGQGGHEGHAADERQASGAGNYGLGF